MGHSPVTLASMSRIRKRNRAAKRAALGGLTLTTEQVELAVAEFDALSKTLGELTVKSEHWTEDTSPREIDALMKRADELTAQHRKPSAHPQIHVVIVAREKKS
jgi:hypothetical protein